MLDAEENEPGIHCVGMPIFDGAGQVAGAMSVSTSMSRIDRRTLISFVPALRKATLAVSHELGWEPENSELAGPAKETRARAARTKPAAKRPTRWRPPAEAEARRWRAPKPRGFASWRSIHERTAGSRTNAHDGAVDRGEVLHRARRRHIFSTPNLVLMLEETAIEALKPFLKPGQACVGSKIEINHTAPTLRASACARP